MCNGTTDATKVDLTPLSHFKDWSNYLLVTTVAALGWVARNDADLGKRWQIACVVLLAASIVFAMFTLALIPLIAEKLTGARPFCGHRDCKDKPCQTACPCRSDEPPAYEPQERSFYDVVVCARPFFFRLPIVVKAVCWPQHVLFIVGIGVYAAGIVARHWDQLGSAAGSAVAGS